MMTASLNRLMMGAVATASFVGVLASSAPVHGSTASDRGAGILIWPKIVTDTSVDTLIQIANLSAGQCSGGVRDNQGCVIDADCPNVVGGAGASCVNGGGVVATHCFYVNANRHCTTNGDVCTTGADCFDAGTGITGSCVEGWVEVNFDIFLTPDQPLAWLASEGLGGSDLPCQPAPFANCAVIPNTQPLQRYTNGGTRVPPVPETPFIGELKCIQVDSNTRRPAVCADGDCRNDLFGTATVEDVSSGTPDPARYNAVGLVALSNDGDGDLGIGADADEGPEYDACASVLVLDHLFDNGLDPISGANLATTELTLVPCSQDFLTQDLTPITAQFLVYNEFEQRFSASRQVRCLLDTDLSRIDTTQPLRSVFSAGVSGTIAGQTRISGVNGGLVGSAILNLDGTASGGSAGYNLNQQADRVEGDRIRIP